MTRSKLANEVEGTNSGRLVELGSLGGDEKPCLERFSRDIVPMRSRLPPKLERLKIPLVAIANPALQFFLELYGRFGEGAAEVAQQCTCSECLGTHQAGARQPKPRHGLTNSVHYLS